MLNNEIKFSDQWAMEAQLGDEEIDAYAFSQLSMEVHFILSELLPLKGKRILDVGCGLGENAILLARLGADVTAMDISPQMLNNVEHIAKRYNVSCKTSLQNGEILDFEPASFDVALCANVFHHIENKEFFLRNLHQILKIDGIVCFWDPLKYNPLINIYRKMASKNRTETEKPVGISELKMISKYFTIEKKRFFWLTMQAIFLKFFFFDRVHPNSDKYYKRIYHVEYKKTWWRPFKAMDYVLCALPLLRWLSWNIVVIARKTSSQPKNTKS